MSWTDERVEKMKALNAEGYSAGQIAKRLGSVTRNAVIGKMVRLGVPLKNAVGRIDPQTLANRMANAKLKAAAKARRAKVAAEQKRTSRSAPLFEFAPVPIPGPAPDDVARVQLVDLETHHCRWPIGEPVEGFCGDQKLDGLSYCHRHAIRAYAPPRPRSSPPAEPERTFDKFKLREFA